MIDPMEELSFVVQVAKLDSGTGQFEATLLIDPMERLAAVVQILNLDTATGQFNKRHS